MKLKDLEPLPSTPFFSFHSPLAFENKSPKSLLKRPYLLPEMDDLILDEDGAVIGVIELKDRFVFEFLFDRAFEKALFPKYRSGDSVEIFINTRVDMGLCVTHQYCHQFVFLPEAIEGVQAAEVTKFRTDETHELASKEQLMTKQTGETQFAFTIMKSALFGFSQKVEHLGFAIRINVKGLAKMSFPHGVDNVSFERYPHLWATFDREIK